jgi:two-component system, CitB family, response regulator DctR
MIRVLLVEDDPMVQAVNAQFVSKVGGFEVVGTAITGEEALMKLEELKPDLVLLDIYMPKRDGKETIREIRMRNEHVDVIVISAANDADTVREMLRHGAIDYIIKPFQFERIQQALKRYEKLRNDLNQNKTISQQQVDCWLYANSKPVHTGLPKGLQQQTLRQVMLYLETQIVPRSAEETAEAIGIARVTARRYLEYLAEAGEIERDVQYGTIGRPIHKYILRPKRPK